MQKILKLLFIFITVALEFIEIKLYIIEQHYGHINFQRFAGYM